MSSLKFFALLLIAGCAVAGPIQKQDMEKFFKEFAAGVPDKGVKALDPAVVTNINYPEETLDINTYFPELKVTGLKNAVVSDYSKNEDNVAHLGLSFNMVAEGPVSLQFPKKNKELKGTIKYEAAITSDITFSLANNEFGPESIACEASNAKFSIPKDFWETQEKDSDASAIEPQYDTIKAKHIKKVACEIAKAALRLIVEDFRAIKKAGL